MDDFGFHKDCKEVFVWTQKWLMVKKKLLYTILSALGFKLAVAIYFLRIFSTTEDGGSNGKYKVHNLYFV